ncbi:MAG: family 16 glycosylhydrolase [Pseudomonadota bacterium]
MRHAFLPLNGCMHTVLAATMVLAGALLPATAGHSDAQTNLNTCDQNLLTLTSYEGYQPCPTGYTLAIDDRFDYFDNTIWERSTGGFPDNECRFIDAPDDRVSFNADGIMRLIMEQRDVPASYSRHEKKIVGAKPCASGELRTLAEYGPYGRLEARMKSPQSSGFVQSLFTFKFYKDPWQEIDIELQGRLPDEISTNVISNHAKDFNECDVYQCTHNTEQHNDIGARHADSWHVYTIDWLPDRVDFYVDGELKRPVTQSDINNAGGNFPNSPATILMNFWLPNRKIAKWFGGEWSLDQLPLEAKYDWFRYYKLNNNKVTSALD